VPTFHNLTQVYLNNTSAEGDEIELKVREIIGHDLCYNGVFPNVKLPHSWNKSG